MKLSALIRARLDRFIVTNRNAAEEWRQAGEKSAEGALRVAMMSLVDVREELCSEATKIENDGQALRERIREVLENHAERCLDDSEDRERVLDALCAALSHEHQREGVHHG